MSGESVGAGHLGNQYGECLSEHCDVSSLCPLQKPGGDKSGAKCRPTKTIKMAVSQTTFKTLKHKSFMKLKRCVTVC